MGNYEVKARIAEIEPFLTELSAHLEKEGFVQRVHLHEPRQQEEILQMAREEEIVSIEIDRRAGGECLLRISSQTVDPSSVVQRVVSHLCADLVALFIRPFAQDLKQDDLRDRFSREVGELIARRRKG